MAEKKEQNQKKSVFMAFLSENWPTILAMLYLVSPIDAIPDALVPIVGQADDAFIMVLELIRRYYVFRKKSK